jgi:type II secretory pathway component PulL
MNTTDELERLSGLHKDGALSDIEFTQAKSRLLSQTGATQDGAFRFWQRRRAVRLIVGLVVVALFFMVVFMYNAYH